MFRPILILSAFLLPMVAAAHPGNTDAYGCHTCKTNCPKWGLDYGEYHCHNSKGLPQPEEPVRSIKSETGTGTTVPAPEYKAPKQTETPKEVSTPRETVVPKKTPSPQEASTTKAPKETTVTKEKKAEESKPKRGVVSRVFGWLF